MPLPTPPLRLRKATLSLHDKNRIEDRDHACRVCNAPDNRAVRSASGVTAWTVPPAHARALYVFIITPALGRSFTTADACRVCRPCLNDIKQNRVTIAGNADGDLAIMRALDLPL